MENKQILLTGEVPNEVPNEVLLSVCMITYNHEKYIREALDSILMQKTDFPFEICLGEDVSSDRTREICLEYAKKHPTQIRLFLREEKDKVYMHGIKTGKYNGVRTRRAARGKYVALCEGDDFWTDPLKLQKQVDFLEANPDFSACVHRAKTQVESDLFHEEVFPEMPPEGVYGVLDTLNHMRMFAATASLVYRNYAECVSPWTHQCFMGDRIIFSSLAASGKIKVLPELMSVYRRHAGGMVADFMANKGVLAGMKSRVIYFENIGELVGHAREIEKKRIAMLRYFTRAYVRTCLLPGNLTLSERINGCFDGFFRKPYWNAFLFESGRLSELVGWGKVILSPVKRALKKSKK